MSQDLVKKSRGGRVIKPIDYTEKHRAPEYDSSVDWNTLTVEERIEQLQQCCLNLGFKSVFDASVQEAISVNGVNDSTQRLREFAQDGGFAALFQEMQQSGSFNKRGRPSLVGLPIPTGIPVDDICAMCQTVFQPEWDNICKLDFLQQPFKEWTPELLSSFDFSNFYTSMKEMAPKFMELLESLGRASQNLEQPKYQRYLVFLVAVLANLRNPRNTFFSGMIGLFLYACRVPKRVIGSLNHLGVSVSYSTLRRLISDIAEAQTRRIKTVAASGKAFQASFDNLTMADKARDPRLFNRTTYITYTATFILIPPADRRPEMFTRTKDLHLHLVPTLTPFDFYPTPTDNNNMEEAFRSMMWDSLKAWAKSRNISLPDVKFPMPKIIQLDHQSIPEIMTLPTYDLDEAILADTIKILNRIFDDIGMSSKQREELLILIKGDFLTTRQNRGGQIVMSESAPAHNLQCVEAATGLFHLMMAVLALLFKTHYGELDKDIASLVVWLDELDRDIPRMWNGQKSLVKDFRAAQDFFDTTLDAYIISAMARYYFPNQDHIEQFAIALPAFSEDKITQMINNLAKALSDFNKVGKMRSREQRDPVHENVILFLQHGLIFRNCHLAMRLGDIGRVENSLMYFTPWFQGSGKHNYASETLRLVACLKKIWSGQFKTFWRENALVNLSGKREGFIACDMLNEYVVREIKEMMHPNITPSGDEFLRNKLSLVVMTFKSLRKRMSELLQINTMDFHSSRVNPWKDVEVIVNKVLAGDIASMWVDRDGERRWTVVADLYTRGMDELSMGQGIEKLKASILDERRGDVGEEAGVDPEAGVDDEDRGGGEGDVFGSVDILNDPEWVT